MMLRSLIFINVFALSMGLLILLLERVVSRYGVVSIVINDDKELRAPGGKSLLRVLVENK